MDTAANEDKATKHRKTTTPEFAMVEQTIEDITLSSIRIQQALKIVSGIITELIKSARTCTVVGRPPVPFVESGIKNPKGLFEALLESKSRL
jgi:hypothetical protein